MITEKEFLAVLSIARSTLAELHPDLVWHDAEIINDSDNPDRYWLRVVTEYEDNEIITAIPIGHTDFDTLSFYITRWLVKHIGDTIATVDAASK